MTLFFIEYVFGLAYNTSHDSLQAHVSLRRYTAAMQYTSNMAIVN